MHFLMLKSLSQYLSRTFILQGVGYSIYSHVYNNLRQIKERKARGVVGGLKSGGGGLEMVRYNNNRGIGTMVGGGGCLEKLKIVVFLAKHVSLYIYLNSDFTDTFTFEL